MEKITAYFYVLEGELEMENSGGWVNWNKEVLVSVRGWKSSSIVSVCKCR